MSDLKRENRKMTRVILDHALVVSISSLGADVRYELKTRNVSYTGFFLDFEKPGRFPFTAASIMEIWLEIESGDRIFFNGKMVRKVMPDDPSAKITGPGIAVRIVQIDSKTEQRLKEFVDRKLAEKQLGSPVKSA